MKLHKQQGMTLIMGLIMLIVLTLLALTSFSLGKSNLIVVSNMQQRDQNIAAAREVLEETISSKRFLDAPDDALIDPCGKANTRCIDINGDDNPDLTVALAKPICIKAQAIKNNELDLTSEEGGNCSIGTSSDAFGRGGPTGNSLCANSTWELSAVAVDNLTQAQVTVTQGVDVRAPLTSIDTNCP